jgi:hypothetical protein
VNAQNPEQLRSELDRLQESLATRQSVLHFAHTGVSFIVAMLVAGAAAKLFWDSMRVPLLAYVATLLSLGLTIYGLSHYFKGRRALAGELKRYGDLLELRRQLKLDNPSQLLPR